MHMSNEQVNAKLLLQLFDLAAERWLLDVQSVSRAPISSLTSDCQKISKLAQFHSQSHDNCN